ncbi:hypothetical protein T12_3842 [Trichinella patagoniensis]|uniref:Uncharacterized protein n=1 Tax=Trichinella patagoniensis TaxID=990121 RepID=A0A0V0Z218_9BILA|nr:hypothetical protein T12_3842 [Trichinella patagoniensis]
MILWFVRDTFARAVRYRKGYAAPCDALLCNSWYTLRVAPNCDWHTFSNSVRVLLGQFCSSLLLR